MKAEKALAIWRKTCGRCWYCGRTLRAYDEPEDFGEGIYVTDHIIPKCLGGSSRIDNLIPACSNCNSAKGKMTVEEYRLSIARKAAGIPYFTPTQLTWLREQNFEFRNVILLPFWGELK